MKDKACRHHCTNGGKEEVMKRGCREGRGKKKNQPRCPYLVSVDNASRRCKLDKEWLSWRLDVAQWWLAVNLTTFAVWPLPSRRCYYESERSRGREKRRCQFVPHNALRWHDPRWGATVRPSGTSALDRHTGKLPSSEITGHRTNVCLCLLVHSALFALCHSLIL